MGEGHSRVDRGDHEAQGEPLALRAHLPRGRRLPVDEPCYKNWVPKGRNLMAFGQTASARPIAGAVATMGVSDRVAFLRKTYGLLGVALVAFAVMTGGMMRFMPETSWGFSRWALRGQLNWLLVIGLFMLVG